MVLSSKKSKPKLGKLLPITVVTLGFIIMAIISYPNPWAAAQESSEFLPLTKVVPGMKGTSKTVISGTKIDTFDIEVLGILRGGAATGDSILVRASGEAIKAAGGVAAGMSGSPVYIDGKLIGAITHSLGEGSDPYLALVTPIDEILRVLEASQGYHVGMNQPRVRPWDTSIVLDDNLKAGAGLDLMAPLVMVPVKSPVMISGLGGRAFRTLTEMLKGYGLQPISAPRASPSASSIEPWAVKRKVF
jgi:hypothetical protein